MKKIIVGLGNPGKEYENTYHNAGALLLERLVTEDKETHDKRLTVYKKLFEYVETKDAIYVRSLTFMNESGKAVKEAFKKFCPGVSMSSLSPCLTILHDDSDIPIGGFKISFARNSAGHKGVQSIIDALKTKEFTRVRIGIRPTNETKRQKAGEFALKKITVGDRKILDRVFVEIRKKSIYSQNLA